MARASWVSDGLDGKSPCTSVVDMFGLPFKPIAEVKTAYLNATGLPAVSLMSPQDFWMAVTTAGGMGT